MKKPALLLILLALFVMTGCETTKGLGKDIEKAGQWMQEKVN